MFIGLIASYSLGLFHGYVKQIDKVMRRLDSSKQNRSAVLEYIESNCSQLIINYPELYMHPQIDLCNGYELKLSLKLVSLVITLSTLYNVYLLRMLYRSRLLLAFLIGMWSNFFFIMLYSNDGQILHFLGIISVLINFIIIVSHLILVSFNEQLRPARENTDWNNNRRYQENNNNRAIGNIHNEED
jgi:hypothetical protein